MTSETWTYSAPGIVEIAGDYVSQAPNYAANMKVMLTQTTIKYFVITDATYDVGDNKTYLTLDGQSKYTLTSDAITLHQVSTWSNPTAGFPLTDPQYSDSEHNHDSDYAAIDHTHEGGANDGWTTVDDTWTYSSATEITVPSGAASLYSPGMRIKLTQTTVKYFIVVAVADTILTIYGGTDYTLVSAAISEISFSTHKAPIGFPLDPAKWTVETTSTSDSTKNAPANGTWYNQGGSITIPIGAWVVSYSLLLGATEATDYLMPICYATLSTANNSEVEKKYTRGACGYYIGPGYGTLVMSLDLPAAYLTLAAEDVYYLNIKVGMAGVDSIAVKGTIQTTVIRAVCAYL